MGFTKAARQRALEEITRDTLYVAFAYRVRDDGVLDEVGDPFYRRQAVRWGEVTHHADRSQIVTSEDVTFPPFAGDCTAQLRHWFLITTPSGDGKIMAFGDAEPVGYMHADVDYVLTPAEAKSYKDASPVFARPLAGQELKLPAGYIALFVKE